MSKFMIEVPHEAHTVACAHAVRIFRRTGSHFLTHADWGCADGEHKAWITVEVNSKEEARRILPAAYRSRAKIVRLNKFTLAEVDDQHHHHQRSAA